MNGSQSGIGLPHSKTSRTEWHARISRQRRGVRQPYAAFIVSTLAGFPFIGPRRSCLEFGFSSRRPLDSVPICVKVAR